MFYEGELSLKKLWKYFRRLYEQVSHYRFTKMSHQGSQVSKFLKINESRLNSIRRIVQRSVHRILVETCPDKQRLSCIWNWMQKGYKRCFGRFILGFLRRNEKKLLLSLFFSLWAVKFVLEPITKDFLVSWNFTIHRRLFVLKEIHVGDQWCLTG